MGLSISYSLTLPPPATFEDAVEKITQLRRLAKDVGFLGHGDIPPLGEIEVGTASAEGERHSVNELPSNGEPSFMSVPALRWVRFLAMPGRGTESAAFGLGEYPKHVTAFEPLRSVLVDAPPGFSGRNYCKTQYASLVDEAHFLHCHIALIRLLDRARDLGILTGVADGGQYWETRSEQVLLANLRDNNALVARIVGRLKDQLDKQGPTGYVFRAPIVKAQDFEHLELEGQRLAESPGSPE